MAVDRDARGRWFGRRVIRFPDGSRQRIYLYPSKYNLPNTKLGAEEALRLAINDAIDQFAVAYRAGHGPVGPSVVPRYSALPTIVPDDGRAPAGVAGSRVASPVDDSMPDDTQDEAPALRVVRPVPSSAVPTVAEFVPIWLSKFESGKVSTLVTRKQTIARHLLPRFGHMRLDEITFPVVEAWRKELLATLRPASVASLLAQLRAMLGYAFKMEALPAMPRTWPAQSEGKSRPDYLTFEEADRLIAAAEPLDPWKAMVIVALGTGLRHGELTALRWQDVDLPNRRLSVVENYVLGVTGTPKSGRDRVVPLPSRAWEALRTLSEHQRGPLVFCSDRGRHLKPSQTNHALREICRAAGLAPFGWHRLRHTYGSHLAMRGFYPSVIQRFMGHADSKMTERYIHLSPNFGHDKIDALDGPPPDEARVAASPASEPRNAPSGAWRLAA
ncbi:MAG: site-specific integrase [Kofleriaceae bacterium]